MARISLNAPSTWFTRAARWYARRTYGTSLQPAEAALHNRPVALSYAMFEHGVARWKALDPHLKALAVMAAAQRIGCAWCLDYGFWAFQAQGTPRATLEAVPRWREPDVIASGLFDDTERAVLAYAEAMTGDVAAEVTDEMVADLLHRLGEPALVELTMMVALENQRSRFNSALGLTAQGFSDRCQIPDRDGSRREQPASA